MAAFTLAAGERRREEVLARSAGPFLAGQEGNGTGEFTAWLDGQITRSQGQTGVSGGTRTREA